MLQKEMKIGLSDVEKVEMKNGIKSEVLTSVAGGSPKGTYADLTALQSAFPNGAPGVYLTTDNGHWYYWNSTAWADGGVYQSSGIADRSITPIKTSFISVSRNLFNKDDITQGYYYFNGTITENASWFYSEKIYPTDTSVTIATSQDVFVNQFTVDGTFVSHSYFKVTTTVAINDTAKYIIVSSYISNANALQVENGVTASEYEDYYLPKFNDEIEPYVTEKELDSKVKTIIDDNTMQGKTITKNINSCNLYQSNSYINTSGNIASFTGLNIYKLDLKKISSYKFNSNIDAPDQPLAWLCNANDTKIKRFSASDLDNEISHNANDDSYLLINGWEGDGFTNLNKTISLAYAEFSYETTTNIINTYKTCVNKPYEFNGKTALFFGDSITEGFTSGTTTTQNNYVKLFSDKVGLTFTNKGKGGSCFTRGVNDVQSIVDTIKATTLNTDFVFIAGGVNDCVNGVTEIDFKASLTELITYLKANYSGEVIFITPINYYNIYSTQILDINIYRNVISEFAMLNSYSVVDGSSFNFGTENNSFSSQFFGDGLHPSELGYKLYAKSLATILC